MKKHITLTLIIFIAMFLSMMGNVYAADANGDGYNDNDVSIINNIITNNGLDLEKDKPVNWSDKVITWQVYDANGEKRISSLDFSDYDLYGELDLSGLTNLETLFCSNTKITGLDVSNLTNLTYLACSDTKITELDVSNLPKLEVLFCDNTKITGLDVSNLTNLTYLACSGTEITELDVSNLPRLEVLYCDNTKITKLDVSNLSNLIDLHCYNTGITELDVSNLINLKNLYCDNTEITALDVSNLINLTYLYCNNTKITELDVSNLTNLTYLFCNNTEITELDVSKLTNLTYLDCTNTEITALDVSNLINLTYLFCNNTEITELDVSNLTNLIYLDCTNTEITELDMSNLINLTDLYCNNTEITELDVSNLTNLIYLDCSNTRITKLDVSNLASLRRLGCSLANLTTVMGHLVSVDTDCSNNVFITDYIVSENKVFIIAKPREKFVFDSWLEYPNGSLVDNDRLSVYPDGDIVVSALYVVPTVSFLGSSENQSFSKGVDNSLKFVLDQPNMFGKVYVDDQELKADEGIYSWGILESYPHITLSNIYLDTLNVGTHTIKFVLDNGLQTETKFTIIDSKQSSGNKDSTTGEVATDSGTTDIDTTNNTSDAETNNTSNGETNNPQTGDNIMLYVAILGISLIGILITTKYRKNYKNK